MSFAVVHMQKFKTSGVKGIQFHNQRERESKTNPDIDKSKTDRNYDLHNSANIDFNKRVKEIIKNNVVTNKAIRKDAVVMCNFIVTSDKVFFDRLTDPEQKKFFEKSYEFFKNRYGEKNIVAANVHLDEKTPHMHLSLVPVTEDNRLSAKSLFDRKELRSLQDDFPKFIKEHGFDLERGIDAEGKNKHIETQKLKAMELEKKNKALENDLNALRSDLNKLLNMKPSLDKINAIEGKYGLLNKNKVTINKEDFELLKDIAKRQHILERQIDKLESDNSDVRETVSRNRELQQELRKTKSQLKTFVKDVNLLGEFLKKIGQSENAKKYIRTKKSLQRENDLER